MKKTTLFLTTVVLSAISINSFAASKYQVKAGSWLSAYGSIGACKAVNSYCGRVQLPNHCQPDKLYMEKDRARQVQNAVNKRKNVKVALRSGSKICTIK